MVVNLEKGFYGLQYRFFQSNFTVINRKITEPVMKTSAIMRQIPILQEGISTEDNDVIIQFKSAHCWFSSLQ